MKECSVEFNSPQIKIIQPKVICELLEKRISVLQELNTSIQALITRAQEFINNTSKITEDYHQFSNPFTWQPVNAIGKV